MAQWLTRKESDIVRALLLGKHGQMQQKINAFKGKTKILLNRFSKHNRGALEGYSRT